MNDENVKVITEFEKDRREKLSNQIRIEFQEDSLFRILEEKGWIERIFEEDLLDVRTNETYNTQRAAEILSLKDQQDIRNIFRNLKNYIRPDESTGHHRLDYKAIVRLKMVFLLKQEYTLTSLEKILTSLGKPGSPAKQTDLMYQTIEEVDKKVDILAQYVKQLSETISSQNKILELKGENEDTLQKQIEQQGELIKKLVNNVDPLNERQIKITDEITKRRVEAILRKEAIDLWAQQPHSVRMIKKGLFKSVEDFNKRDSFVEDYIFEHYESRIRAEFGL